MKKANLTNFIASILGCKKSIKLPNATFREAQIAGMIASGLTNKEVAIKLGISIKTVDKHRTSIHKKNHLRNTADLTRWALAKGLAKNEF
jgi:DNA-binding CsgD family transcriptional regulator